MTTWTTGRLAQALGVRCEGSEDAPIQGVAPLHRAGPGQLSFCTEGAEGLERTCAGAVLLHQGVAPEGVVVLRTDRPRLLFAQAIRLLHPEVAPEAGVHPTAVVSARARVHPDASIGPLCVVEAHAEIDAGAHLLAQVYVGEGARVGPGCRLLPHSAVMAGCTLGRQVVLHPGAVVGSDGFGFEPTPEGPVRFPHLGSVVVGDGAEVGANSTVDRGALEDTTLGERAALDNLVQVAHGAQVGPGSLLVAYSGLAGQATVGAGVQLGARAGVREGVRVGDGARLAAWASATTDVPAGATVGGFPAVDYTRWLQERAALRRLPELLRRVRQLERRLEEE